MPNANACIECGKKIAPSTAGENGTAPGSISTQIDASRTGAINYLKREESNDGSSLEMRFTDHAVRALGEPLARALFGRGESRRPASGTNLGGSDRAAASNLIFPEEEDEQIHDATFVETPGSLPPLPQGGSDEHIEQQLLQRVFRVDGETFSLNDHRLKQQSQRDFVRRVSYLFLYAHNRAGRDSVPRESLNTVLRDATVLDGNASSWISSCKDLKKEGDNLRILLPGIDHAKRILEELTDPNVEGTWDFENRSRTSAKKGGNTGQSGVKTASSGTKASGHTNPVDTWVQDWKEGQGQSLNAYELLKNKSVAERALFALWAIRKSSPTAEISISRERIAQFIRGACSFKHDGRGIERTLARSPHVIQDKTKFEINPGGMKHVEQSIESFGADGSNDAGASS